MILGIVLSVSAVSIWEGKGFGQLIPEQMMRITIPAISLIVVGTQIMFAGFIAGIIKIKSRRE